MSDSDETILYLVRHGATEANLRRPYVLQGRGIDLPLSTTGQDQARRVAQLLRNEPLAAAYASPMRRARETAEIILAGNASGGRTLHVESMEGFAECDVGKWEGLDWPRIEAEFPEAYALFQRDAGRYPYLGGESYGDVAARAFPVLERLVRHHRGTSFLIVAHNVVNRACLARILGIDLADAKHLQQANGGVNVLRLREGRIEVVTLNSLFHLEGDGKA